MLSLRVLEYYGEHFIVFHTTKLQITLKKCWFFTLNGHFGDGLVRSLLTSILFIFTLKNVRQTSRTFLKIAYLTVRLLSTSVIYTCGL